MEYYISTNIGKLGPYSAQELKARGLRAESLVMAVGSTVWTPAWQIEELRPYINTPTSQPVDEAKPTDNASTAEATPVEEPIGANNASGGFTSEQANGKENFQQGRPVPPRPSFREPKRHGNGVKGWLIFLIILLAIAGIALITCPREDAHKSALTNVVSSTVSEEMNGKDSTASEDDAIDKAFRQISDSWSKEVVKAAVDNLIHVDNHLVYSVGKVRFAGKEHTVSVGAFGHVFTIDKDDLRKATDAYYSKAEQSVKQSISNKIGTTLQNDVIDPVGKAIQDFVTNELNDFMNELVPSEPSDEQQSDSVPSEGI